MVNSSSIRLFFKSLKTFMMIFPCFILNVFICSRLIRHDGFILMKTKGASIFSKCDKEVPGTINLLPSVNWNWKRINSLPFFDFTLMVLQYRISDSVTKWFPSALVILNRSLCCRKSYKTWIARSILSVSCLIWSKIKYVITVSLQVYRQLLCLHFRMDIKEGSVDKKWTRMNFTGFCWTGYRQY